MEWFTSEALRRGWSGAQFVPEAHTSNYAGCVMWVGAHSEMLPVLKIGAAKHALEGVVSRSGVPSRPVIGDVRRAVGEMAKLCNFVAVEVVRILDWTFSVPEGSKGYAFTLVDEGLVIVLGPISLGPAWPSGANVLDVQLVVPIPWKIIVGVRRSESSRDVMAVRLNESFVFDPVIRTWSQKRLGR